MHARRFLLAWQWVALVAALGLVATGRFTWAVAVLLPAHLAVVWAVLVPGSRLLGPVTRAATGLPGDRAVWLTIDDGPCPVETPAVLEQLDRAGAKATFFLVGERAAAHPELVREIARRGHEVGNHTWSHPAGTFWCLPRGRVAREIARAQDELGRLAGQPPVRFRAPVGMKPPGLHPELARHQLELVGWSARGFDGVSGDVDRVVRRLVRGLRPGAILVIHEGHGHGPELVEALLGLLGGRGYRCAVPPGAGRRKTAR